MVKPSGSDPDIGSSNLSSSTTYTTVCIDIYGRVYDLRHEHPSWEYAKKKKKKDKAPIYERRIVANAFTCTVEECAKLKAKAEKKKGKK